MQRKTKLSGVHITKEIDKNLGILPKVYLERKRKDTRFCV